MSLHFFWNDQLGGPYLGERPLPRTLIPSTASGVSTDKTAANSQVPRPSQSNVWFERARTGGGLSLKKRGGPCWDLVSESFSQITVSSETDVDW